jgi:hypothetical protein
MLTRQSLCPINDSSEEGYGPAITKALPWFSLIERRKRHSIRGPFTWTYFFFSLYEIRKNPVLPLTGAHLR